MPVTLSQSLTNVRYTLDDESSIYWTNAELTQWINDACSDIAKRAEVLQDFRTVNLQANQQDYPSPPRLVRIHKIDATVPANSPNTYLLEYRGLNEMDAVWGLNHTIPAAYPRYWTLWQFPPNLLVRLYPVPAQPGTLNIYFYRLPNPVVANTDLLDLPEDYEPCARRYVEYMAYRKARMAEWQPTKQLYEEELAELIQRSRTFTDQPGTITPLGQNVPWWLYSGGDSY